MGRSKPLNINLELGKKSKLVFSILTTLIFLVFLTVTIYLSVELTIWVDESSSLITTSKGFKDALNSAIYYEYQAPLYFLILWGWRQLDDSIFFGRILSILFAVASIEIFRKKIITYVKDYKLQLLGMVIFAISPFLINISVEMRRYTLVLLLSLVSTFTFIDTYVNLELRKDKRFLYICISLMGFYSDYYFGFLLLAQFLTLLIFFDRSSCRAFILDAIIISILSVPLFYVLKIQFGLMAPKIKEARNEYLYKINLVLTSAEYFLIPINNLFIDNRILRWTLRGLFLISCSYSAFKSKKFIYLSFKNAKIYSILVTILLSIFIFVVSSLSAPHFLLYHHFTILYGLLIFATLLIISAQEKQLKITYFFLMLIIVSNFAFIAYSENFFSRSGSWSHKFVANYLKENEMFNQPILIYPSEYEHGLNTYYCGVNRILSIKPISYYKFDPDEQSINSKEELEILLSKIQIGHEFWLVSYCWNSRLYSNDCKILKEYLQKYDLLKRMKFEQYGSIELYREKQKK
jgi:uncharacterized membrane protein